MESLWTLRLRAPWCAAYLRYRCVLEVYLHYPFLVPYFTSMAAVPCFQEDMIRFEDAEGEKLLPLDMSALVRERLDVIGTWVLMVILQIVSSAYT